ncbi:uncharacterized protein LOC113397697 isoform X5 [Vanessa tameamea]|uniref:Uncharacterized protein LOC113397697 isoform X5 n=1 Tax=Vanessa tameamea TaxID=334116 RepID=A0A8B8I4K8_VANTA|nr:uncharacterized protein LOC113397697 isoform X5 [Vanessa tameamea]XP_047539319.1 uncharacterized protein LOC125072694 isoform X2 [Vanessa atalanta]
MDLISSIMVGVFIFMCLYLFWLWFCFGSCLKNRQKTRNSQQRRTYMGSRQRPSDSQSEPTVYVSPSNYPPPPKYEAMAPPSYEEVVGIHYPSFQPTVQPITQPITAALAQGSNSTNSENENSANSNVNVVPNNVNVRNDNVTPSTVITVNADERTTVTVAAS